MYKEPSHMISKCLYETLDLGGATHKNATKGFIGGVEWPASVPWGIIEARKGLVSP